MISGAQHEGRRDPEERARVRAEAEVPEGDEGSRARAGKSCWGASIYDVRTVGREGGTFKSRHSKQP